MPFVKLDTGILDSTLWVERECREVFITALLLAEPIELASPVEQIAVRTLEKTGFVVPPGWYGFIRAAGVGILRRALVDIEQGMCALEKLGALDPESRSPDFGGRRLVRVDGGYLVLNYMKYRDRDYSAAERQHRLRLRRAIRAATAEFGDEWKLIEAFYGGMCAYCEKQPWTDLDLMVPLEKGGEKEPGNMVPACKFCVNLKGQKVWKPKRPHPYNLALRVTADTSRAT